MAVVESSEKNLEKARTIILKGGSVGFPTETVYGLGADATNAQAVAKIFEIKGRPVFNPLIVHFSKKEDVYKHVKMTPMAKTLMMAFWPGPLTLVMNKKRESSIVSLVTAGLDTIAVRVPQHPIGRKFIEYTQKPIAAPSANMSGTLSPTTALHVDRSLGDKIALILAGGQAKTGLESTIVDVTTDDPVILRLGIITKKDIAEALECNQNTIRLSLGGGSESEKPKSPGQLLKHYAPSLPIRLKATNCESDEAFLAFGPLLSREIQAVQALNLSESGDLYEAAGNLFSMLHELDQSGAKAIAVMDVPNVGIGLAINDRLQRAAY